MAEGNGSGRLDRIEAILEKLVERTSTTTWLHEDRIQKIENNIVEMQEEEKTYRAAQRQRDEEFSERVNDLVVAMGKFVRDAPRP
jgi:hypothetical protein